MIEISAIAKEFASKSMETAKHFDPDAKAEVSSKEIKNKNLKEFDPDSKAEISKSPVELLKEQNPNGLEARKTYEINEHKIETDDNGNPYKQDNELLPNNEYNMRGYKYETDDKGRINHVSGDLQWKDHDGRLEMPDNIHDIGKGYERKTDDRGHLIADEFNGSGGKENLVPMDRYINQNGDYRKLEREWEQAKKNGKDVYVDIRPEYSGDSRRPDSFNVGYKIDGIYYEKTFLNENNKGVN